MVNPIVQADAASGAVDLSSAPVLGETGRRTVVQPGDDGLSVRRDPVALTSAVRPSAPQVDSIHDSSRVVELNARQSALRYWRLKQKVTTALEAEDYTLVLRRLDEAREALDDFETMVNNRRGLESELLRRATRRSDIEALKVLHQALYSATALARLQKSKLVLINKTILHARSEYQYEPDVLDAMPIALALRLRRSLASLPEMISTLLIAFKDRRLLRAAGGAKFVATFGAETKLKERCLQLLETQTQEQNLAATALRSCRQAYNKTMGEASGFFDHAVNVSLDITDFCSKFLDLNGEHITFYPFVLQVVGNSYLADPLLRTNVL